MDVSAADVLGPLFYGQAAVGAVVLGSWFAARKTDSSKAFGIGLYLVAAAFATWTVANIVRPEGDWLGGLMLVGSVCFLASSIAFARVGWRAIGREMRSKGMMVASVLVLTTLVVRMFFAKSAPHFNDDGWLYLGIHPVTAALFIATLSMTLLPAIGVVTREIEDRTTQMVMQVGFHALFVNVVVTFASRENALIEINSVAAGVTMFLLWVFALSKRNTALAVTA